MSSRQDRCCAMIQSGDIAIEMVEEDGNEWSVIARSQPALVVIVFSSRQVISPDKSPLSAVHLPIRSLIAPCSVCLRIWANTIPLVQVCYLARTALA